MAWFGEADHAANPPPYLTLWWIPVSNTYESMPNPVHMDTTYWWYILVPHTEYTHKYNHAGIKTWGKWLQKQLISATQRAWHRTMVSEPSTYHDLLHPLHWALHVTQAQTSYINASMHVFATKNHSDSFAATWRRLRIKCNIKCHIECHTTTQIIARICIHAHQLRRGWGCESIVDGWSLWVFMRPCTLHSPFHSPFRSPYISQCIVHDKSADNYALMSTP